MADHGGWQHHDILTLDTIEGWYFNTSVTCDQHPHAHGFIMLNIVIPPPLCPIPPTFLTKHPLSILNGDRTNQLPFWKLLSPIVFNLSQWRPAAYDCICIWIIEAGKHIIHCHSFSPIAASRALYYNSYNIRFHIVIENFTCNVLYLYSVFHLNIFTHV